MKIASEAEIKPKTLLIEAQVRYWEDASVNGVDDEDGNLIPFRVGDLWVPEIDLLSGIVIGWPSGVCADIHYKVCDAGEYWLMDENGVKIAKYNDYYVPHFLAIESEGYGDYIIMKIDEGGRINNWRFDPSGFALAAPQE